MKSSMKLNALVSSLEAIEESKVEDLESSDAEMRDAQIALEGYQDLLTVHTSLQKKGVQFNEAIVGNLLSLASPKINKDPLLSTYSEESIGEKAKDFGKWIVEKIKALIEWIAKRLGNLKNLAEKIFSKITETNWKKAMEQVKSSVTDSYKVSVKELLAVSQLNEKYIDGAELKDSDVVLFDLQNIPRVLGGMQYFQQIVASDIEEIIKHFENTNKLNESKIKFAMLKIFKDLIKELKSGDKKATFKSKNVIMSDFIPAFYFVDEIEALLNVENLTDIKDAGKNNTVDGNYYFGFSNTSAYKELCEELLGDYGNAEVTISSKKVFEIMKFYHEGVEHWKKEFAQLFKEVDETSKKLTEFTDKIVSSAGNDLDKFEEIVSVRYRDIYGIQLYHEAMMKMLLTSIYTISSGANGVMAATIRR